jgi:hypothetical protein
MYGWPKDLDHEIFVGHLAEAVTFAENVIVLVFSDGLVVSISGTVVYQRSPDAAVERERADAPLKRARARVELPLERTGLIGVVGQVVEGVELRSPKEVILRFEDGFSVTLLDDNDDYECYLIEVDGRKIAV